MSAMDSLEQVDGQRDAFIERFLQSAAGAFNMLSIYMGDRLSLYRALADDGPAGGAIHGRVGGRGQPTRARKLS